MSYKTYQKYYNKNKIEVSKDNRDLKEVEKIDKSIFGILIAVLALVPLITRLKVIEYTSPLLTNNNNLGSGTVGDVFTAYKYIFLVTATVTLLILFLYRTYGLGIPIKQSFTNIALAVLAVVVTLSTVLSVDKSLALFGMYNRHEGALTYLCYFTLFFIAANLIYTKKMLFTVIYALYPVTIINTLLGLLGFYGIELINTSFARAILFPSGISEEAISTGSKFITTINHQNYVSGISVVLIVIFMMMFILDKDKKRQAANGFLAILSFAMMLSSLSRSGFLTFVIILPILAIMLIFSTEKRKSFGKLAIQLVVFVTIFIGMANYNPKVWDESMGMFIDENPFAKSEQAIAEKAIGIKSTSQSDFNSDNTEIINKETVNDYKQFTKDQLNGFSLNSTVYAEEISRTAEGNFQLPKLPDSGVGAGSGRLFIWGNTIDLIKHRPLIGYGLDTFVYHFPQYDPDKIANLETHTVIVDKPHNLYINLLYSSGIIALLAFFALLVVYLVKSVKVVMSQKTGNEQKFVFFALFIGWIAYLTQALFNDSVIGTAPIFWICFGVMLSLAKKLKEIN